MNTNSSNNSLKVGFLGFGKMGQAIATGLSKANDYQISAFDIALNLSETSAQLPIHYVKSISELESWSDLILLCMKPQDIESAIQQLTGNKKYLSIAAGVSTTNIALMFNQNKPKPPIARSMPNLGATIGQSTTAVYCEDNQLLTTSLHLFQNIGFAFSVSKESLMHSVTGLSGSGPAYVFLFIQSLAEAGVREGLSYDQSLQMAINTVSASAKLLSESKEHPAELISKVCSPGGTTIEGMANLEKNGFRNSIFEAVHSATQRSKELSIENHTKQ
ncbi:MAG: pyrroline-5-carboxylate reductase [Leptonema sp. (in: Bacteria)]|nr:pyrroline-5-carboxylate reductase [Leptonema sp. (in: bacteria)]